MSHFWLKPDEQALMDSATATAHDYGYIGAFDLGTNTKTALKKLLGYEAKPEDQIRPYKLVSQTRYAVSSQRRGPNMNVKVLVRVTKNQAMRLKLSLTDDDLMARLLDDPTGEFWGNLLIAQSLGPKWSVPHGYECRFSVIDGMRSLMKGNGFGPTLDRVATFSEALPDNWRTAFVNEHFAKWHEASDTVTYTRVQDEAALQPDLFKTRVVQQGMEFARLFYERCQFVSYRQKVGIE